MAIQTRDVTGVVRPKRWTLWLRSALVWQFIRFVIINVRMVVMIMKSHQGARRTARLQRGIAEARTPS